MQNLPDKFLGQAQITTRRRHELQRDKSHPTLRCPALEICGALPEFGRVPRGLAWDLLL